MRRIWMGSLVLSLGWVLPEALVPDVAPRIREIMERAYRLAAPLAVSVACGPNWQDLVDVA